jgi:hypothetical protein
MLIQALLISGFMINCRSHTYGDSIYEASIDLRSNRVTLTGSDTWYHQDFLNVEFKNLKITPKDEAFSIEGDQFSMTANPKSKKEFGSPADYNGTKIDFDCRN